MRSEPLKEIQAGCLVTTREKPCENTRKTSKMFNWSLEEYDSVVWTHANCHCNELVALRNRHQYESGIMFRAHAQTRRGLNVLKSSIHCLPLQVASKQHIINVASGKRKKRLTRAFQTLSNNALAYKDADIKMFIKDDKYHQPEHKAPRAIQYRDPRFNLEYATYIHPIEEVVYKIQDRFQANIFAKNRNMRQRALDLRRKWEGFTNPVAYCLDHSKFDAHVRQDMLKICHEFYKGLFQHSDRHRLGSLLKEQLINRGRTKNGTKYRTIGTRMSGDQDTGLGNSVLNFSMLWSKFGAKAAYYIDGDDSVVITEGPVGFDNCSEFGMDTKCDVVYTFEHIDFCQTRPVYNGHYWCLLRNPYRVIKRVPWLVRDHQRSHAKYMNAVALGEIALGTGFPVIAPLMKQFVNGMALPNLRPDIWRLVDKIREYQPPTDQSRESYHLAWGIDPNEQRRIEGMTVCAARINYALNILRPDENKINEPKCLRENKNVMLRRQLCRENNELLPLLQE